MTRNNMTQPTSDAVRQGEWIEEFDMMVPKVGPLIFDTGFKVQNELLAYSHNRKREQIKSFIQQEKDKSYQEGLHEMAIKADKGMIDWLKNNTDGVKMVDEVKSESYQKGYNEGHKDCKSHSEEVKKAYQEGANSIQAINDSMLEAARKEVRSELAAVDPVWLAECFHDFYESYAKIKGWKTQENCTNIPFKDLPEENRQTMICTASSVLYELTGKLALLSLLTPKTK